MASWGGDAQGSSGEGDPFSFPSPGCSESARLSRVPGLRAFPRDPPPFPRDQLLQPGPPWLVRGGGAEAKDTVARVGPVLQAAIPYLPPAPAGKELQAGRAPREVLYCEQQEGRAQHFVPSATVLGFLSQPDGSTDAARVRRRPSLLPPHAGSRPNSAFGPTVVNLPRPPWHRLGSAAVGMLQWGAGWDHGAEGRDVGRRSGFVLAGASRRA